MSTVRKIRWKNSHNIDSGYNIVPIPITTNHDFEQYTRQVVGKMKKFDMTLNGDMSYRLHGCLKERLQKVQKQQLRLIYRYMNRIERLPKLLNNTPNDSLNRTLRNKMDLALNDTIDEINQNLEDLETKAGFISNLKKQKFKYYNAAEYHIDKTDNEYTLERKLVKNYQYDRILCSNDILYSNNQSNINKLMRQLAEERMTNLNLRLIYADFSYCSFELHDIMILPSNNKIPRQNSSLSFTKKQTFSSSLPNNDCINILLLGETGIGKSTFINAFVNYLTFNTLAQAEKNKPVTLIPVSFLITTGHNFNEHLIKFGDFNSSNDEDFDHPGQSVTQYCKSYQFDLKHINGKKLCIIDTPGFGDTRGLDQDDLNLQLTLKYINNLTHLNAVCFLFKSNVTRLHIFFRTCLTQLFALLGPNAHQNIIFCFTNARSTFYTPGDTAPLLRNMLESFSINNIPFNKENTFCFDNEAFRYLVALQNGIQFNNEEKREYEISWSTSVKESNRFLNYIQTQLSIYSLHHGWQSIKHAQIEIINMIRPILETIRNILRNLILWKISDSNKSIELQPKAIHHPLAFCISCKRDPFPLNNFWILPDHPHQLRNKCLTCQCESNQHILTDYVLSYDIINNSFHEQQQNEMNDILNRLCLASTEFAYFLINVAHSTEEDPFLIGLKRIIYEEKHICATKESNHLNLELVKELEKFIIKYEEQMKIIQSNQKHGDLQMIYEWINTICYYPMIREQMAAIHHKEEKHKNEQYNFDTSNNSKHQKTSSSTALKSFDV